MKSDPCVSMVRNLRRVIPWLGILALLLHRESRLDRGRRRSGGAPGQDSCRGAPPPGAARHA